MFFVDIIIDGQIGTLNCGGCFQVQVTACQTQSCAAPIDSYFACRTNNNCADGAACAACDTQLGAANSCLMANEASIDTCIDSLAGMCFGETVADPGCAARFDRGISGDDCAPRCSQDTANTIISCPADDPNTANNEASDCRDAALVADTTPTGMIDPFTDPIGCKTC